MKTKHADLASFLDELVARGGTQEAFAEQLGISPSHLSELKLGRQLPSLALAKRLADACGIPIESFLP